MTRILIASLNYAPEETGIAPYSTKLAEHLASQAYDVTVVTGMPHYPAWSVAREYASVARTAERINGVEVRRRAHYVPATQSALRRARYEATSLMMAADALRGRKPDAVIGVMPSLSGGLVARAAATRFGVPYGLIVQDLMGQAAGQSGIAGAGRAASLIRAAEGFAMRGAATVGVIAEGFRPYVEALGVDAPRVRRIRNWTHVAPAMVGRAEMRERLGWPGDALVCLHAGNMGHKQGLENVIEAARIAAASNMPVVFAFAGDGNQRAMLETLAARHRLPNVRFMPLQPADVFSGMLAAADILLINQRASVRDMSLPSKLTSYYAAGRPVVAAAAADSETAREITASSGGIVAPPDDPHALIETILRVANDRGLAMHLARNARAWAESTLSEPAALRSLEQLVAATLAAGTHGRVHTPYRARPTVVRQDDHADSAPANGGDRWAA
jgi:glycosyltransferase involved in cell wall biosynthesis